MRFYSFPSPTWRTLRLGSISFGLVLGSGCGDAQHQADLDAASPAMQSAASSSTTGTVTFAANGQKCMDVVWGNTANGTGVQLADCNGGAAQNWTYVGGTLQVFGNKCLDVPNANGQNGQTLQIWDCVSGSQAQQWTRSGNTFIFKNAYCIDLPNGNQTDGTRLQLYGCGPSGNVNQSWNFTGSTAAAASVDASGAATFKTNGNQAYCMDVAGGVSQNMAGIQLAQCSGNPAQSFTLNGGQLKALGRCVDIPMGNTTNGTKIQLYDCLANDPTQQWVWTGQQLKVAGQNKCIDVNNGNFTDGQRLQVWDCSTGTDHQLFTRTTAGASTTSSSGSTSTAASAPTGSGPQASVAQPAGSLNALDYGVKGDNVTDNTAALQNAFNTAQNQGKTLFIPAGTYLHSGMITLYATKVVGAGTSTLLRATQQSNSAIKLTGANPSLSYVATSVNASNRSSQPQDCAVLVQFATNATVANISVQGASANGIRVDRASGSRITGNFVNGSNADGIALVNGATGTLVQGCQVNNASDDSYSSDSYPGEPQNNGNVFDSCYAGPNYKQGRSFALMGSAGETIRNCVSNGSLWHGIIAGTDPSSTTQAGSGFTISNNLVYANASGLPVMVSTDGGMNYNGSAGLANVSGTKTSGAPAATLGWTPSSNVASPSTFSSYTGGGPGSANTPGNRQ